MTGKTVAYRRRYRPGVCQDCGWHRNVTKAVFWVNGFAMLLCAECLRVYRPVLLRPGSLSDPRYTRTVHDREAPTM